jgi:amino acid adenylation domain-containing protein
LTGDSPDPLLRLLDECAARGIALAVGAGGALKVRAPAGALTPELRTALESRKPDLLALLASRAGPAIPRVDRSGPMPLTPAQARLWFLTRLDPRSSAAYHIVVVVRIRGPLSPAALERAVNALAVRHESLRTAFAASAEGGVQQVADRATVPFAHLDLGTMPAPRREEELAAWLGRDGAEPFDLARPPLARAALFQMEADEAVFVLTLHHLISDGWSSGVIIRDLGALYEAETGGAASSLPEMPVQYGDYVAWQALRLASPETEGSVAYWVDALRGAPVLNLPSDRPRPAAMTFRGRTLSHTLPSTQAADLRALARREGCTLFQVLLAGFCALLHRYSGQEDMTVGTSIANRDDPALEPLIGLLTNTLALRIRCPGRADFRSFLADVRAAAEQAYRHAETPLDRVIEALQPERTLSQNPVFQVCFSLLQAHRDTLRVAGLELDRLDPPSETARFDLTVTAEDTRAGLLLLFEYGTDLFDAATIERMASHYGRLLESAAAAPEAAVGRLAMLSPPERETLLRGWNASATPYPRERCVHELFEECAAAAPRSPAVVAGDRTLTYGELDALATRLAGRLRSEGVGPDCAVAVCAERTLEMVVALVAVLKAGGCYLPFDPGDPPDRLGYLFASAGVKRMLAPAEAGSRLPALEGIAWLPVDLANLAAPASAPAPASGANPDNLAYITFTSGSTGRPKGICIPHRGVVRLVRNTNYLAYGPDLRILELAPVSFDASTFELWGALCNGGVLVVFRAGPPTIRDLADAIQSQRITSLYLTSALFNLMMEERPEAFAGVRHLLLGGDALSPRHVSGVLAAHPGLTVINGYGPTEATTFASCGILHRPDEVGASVTIGPPMSNTTVYILDPWLEPVPVGVPGDLYLGGDGNARGYLGLPDLTAESFVPNPHPQRPGERIYRTGDLARWRPDGTGEFLGRRDFQVKIRGFRVEPEEIETVLARHPAVRKAIVLVRIEGQSKSLVACIQPRPGAEFPGADALKAHLRARLPEFMVPAAFVPVADFPLTAHNKVDRAALGRTAAGSLPAAPAYSPPSGPVAELLSSLWSDVLAKPKVGGTDNFFDRGGHSLLATRLIWRMSEAFRCDLPLRLVFETPTLEALAAAVSAQVNSAAGQPGRAERIARVHLQVARLSADEVSVKLAGGSGVTSR